MYLDLQNRFAEHLRGVLESKYDLELQNIPIEIPPDLKFGELSTPIALQLARSLRKSPKIIAQEIARANERLNAAEPLDSKSVPA